MDLIGIMMQQWRGRDVSGNLGGLACRDFTRLGCGGKRRGAEACLGNASDRDGWEAPNHHFPSSSRYMYIYIYLEPGVLLPNISATRSLVRNIEGTGR